MEQHFKVAFGRIADHLRERQRRIFRPWDSIFARFQSAAKSMTKSSDVFSPCRSASR